MTNKCIHCGKNPTRDDSAHLEKVTSELYDISQILTSEIYKKCIDSYIKPTKIPVTIEWYSDGSRKIIVMEKGWSNFVLEEIDRHGKGIRKEICKKLLENDK